MASYRANGRLIQRLREVIGRYDPKFTKNLSFCSYMNLYGEIADGTVKSALRSGDCYEKSFVGLAVGLSSKLREVWMSNPDSEGFDPLRTPDIGWLIERLERGDRLPLAADDLIMDHEERYLIEDFKLRLVVCPCIGQTTKVERSGQAPEEFHFNDIALLEDRIIFSDINRKKERGFKLKYGTYHGRIKVLEPGERELLDEKGYRLHKRNAVYEPDPGVNASQHFRLLVFGGYGPGEESMHATLDQPALYQNASYTLDLGAYSESAIAKEPELLIVPVLKDRRFDCCDIARRGEGMRVAHDERQGRTWVWRFKGLMNVMICLRWEIDHAKIGEAGGRPLDDILINTMRVR